MEDSDTASGVGETIVVTGAAGSVGSRVLQPLADQPGISAVLALDLALVGPVDRKVRKVRVDLGRDDLKPIFEGATTVVHLASSFAPKHDGLDVAEVDIGTARRVLDAASAVGVRRLVLLSSAMVYGAWATNPMPITEAQKPRPNPEFEFAQVKTELERLADDWRLAHPGSEVVILRPATALAENDVSWVARALRAAALIDAGDGDPPQQFLHLDDLASAVTLAASGGMDGAYNVAPDGSVDGDTCRGLSGRLPRLRVPEHLAARLGRFGWRHRLTPVPPGLVPFTIHPCVVANDRLRSAGWTPEHTNEEAYVDGTPPRPWATMNAKRRQQLALGSATVVGAGLAGGVMAVWRRVRRASLTGGS